MKREQFDKLYLGKAVLCKTEEFANEFLELADSVRYRWLSWTSLLNTNNWEDYKNETCYLVRDNPLKKECAITYCDVTHYDVSGIEIVEFKSLKEDDILLHEKIDRQRYELKHLNKKYKKAVDKIKLLKAQNEKLGQENNKLFVDLVNLGTLKPQFDDLIAKKNMFKRQYILAWNEISCLKKENEKLKSKLSLYKLSAQALVERKKEVN